MLRRKILEPNEPIEPRPFDCVVKAFADEFLNAYKSWSVSDKGRVVYPRTDALLEGHETLFVNDASFVFKSTVREQGAGLAFDGKRFASHMRSLTWPMPWPGCEESHGSLDRLLSGALHAAIRAYQEANKQWLADKKLGHRFKPGDSVVVGSADDSYHGVIDEVDELYGFYGFEQDEEGIDIEWVAWEDIDAHPMNGGKGGYASCG